MQVGLARVRGRSMEPTYVDGDRVVVVYGLAPKVGRCHIVQLPDGPDGPRPLAIKRVTARQADGWWVERDNPREGVDSWLVGALADDAMRARVITPWRAPKVGDFVRLGRMKRPTLVRLRKKR